MFKLLQRVKPDPQARLEKHLDRLAQQLPQVGQRQAGGGGQGRLRRFRRLRCLGCWLLMHPRPVSGIGPMRRILQKIGLRERLQGLLPGLNGRPPAALQVVQQLRHQHRRRLFAVVGGAVALPADVELVPRRQNGFQKQVAVVLTARTVARSPTQVHQVKVAGGLLPRVVAVVHAQQTNHLEGDRAHRHQCAKLHAAAKKALLQTAFFKLRQPMLAHDIQRQGGLKLCRLASLQPHPQRGQAALDKPLVGVVGGCKKALDNAGQNGPPLRRGFAVRQFLQGLADRRDPIQQGADHGGIEPVQGRLRQGGAPGRARADGIAQQQPPQAEGPGVLIQVSHARGHTPGHAVLGIQAPAHTGQGQPVVQLRHVGLINAKTLAHCRHFKQTQPVGQRQPGRRQ